MRLFALAGLLWAQVGRLRQAGIKKDGVTPSFFVVLVLWQQTAEQSPLALGLFQVGSNQYDLHAVDLAFDMERVVGQTDALD